MQGAHRGLGLALHQPILFQLNKLTVIFFNFYLKLQLIFQRTRTVSYWLINFLESKESVMAQYLPLETALLLKPAPTPALLKLQNVRAVMWQSPWDSQQRGEALRCSPSHGRTLACWLTLETIRAQLIFPRASCRASSRGFFGGQCTLPSWAVGGQDFRCHLTG